MKSATGVWVNSEGEAEPIVLSVKVVPVLLHNKFELIQVNSL